MIIIIITMIIITLLFMLMTCTFINGLTNSADPDKIPRSKALRLHCLLKYLFTGFQCLKTESNYLKTYTMSQIRVDINQLRIIQSESLKIIHYFCMTGENHVS